MRLHMISILRIGRRRRTNAPPGRRGRREPKNEPSMDSRRSMRLRDAIWNLPLRTLRRCGETAFSQRTHRTPSCWGNPQPFRNIPGALERCVSPHHLGARASRPRWEHASCLRPPREGGASSPYRGRFFGGACVPALVLGFRTPNLPLLLFVGAGGRGDEGQKRTGMQKTLHMWIVCAHSLSSVRTRL